MRPAPLPLPCVLLFAPLLACAAPKSGVPEEAGAAPEAEAPAPASAAPAGQAAPASAPADDLEQAPVEREPALADPGAGLDVAVPSINGGLNRDIIRRIASDHAAEIRGCQARAPKTDLGGELIVEIELDDEGRVVEAELADASGVTQREVVSCVLGLVALWSFPEVGGRGRAEIAFDLASR